MGNLRRGSVISLGAPASFSATGQTLNWSAVTDAREYEVERLLGDQSAFQLLTTVTAPTVTLDVSGAGIGGQTPFRLRAKAYGWRGAYTDPVTVDFGSGGTVPGQPTGLNVTTAGTLTWDDDPEALRWTIWRAAGASPDPGDYAQVGTAMNPGDPSFVDGGASALTGDYTYYIIAENANGPSVPSATDTVTYDTPDPLAEYIVTAFDRIAFRAHDGRVTHTSTGSGNWKTGGTWDAGTVPTSASVVKVAAGHTVTLDGTDCACESLAVYGILDSPTNADSTLTYTNFYCVAGGRVRSGTSGGRMGAGVVAKFITRDTPLDTTNDPRQHGNGFVCLGAVQQYGAALSKSFVRLAAEPLAGATTLTLSEAVTGWAVGDQVLIPDTRQIRHSDRQYYSPQFNTEFRTIAGISGTTITLNSALSYDHRGARNENDTLEIYPHVALITRNVRWESENPSGVRGHWMATIGADVDLHEVEFKGLGRTGNHRLNNSTFTNPATPDVATSVGTNQVGKYALHLHHLYGREGVSPQYKIHNCSIHEQTLTAWALTTDTPTVNAPPRWGINLHDVSYGECIGNVIFNYAGSTLFVGEMGSESYNVIEGNFCCRCLGTRGRPDERGGEFGFEGYHYWFRNGLNYVRDNVCCEGDGYMMYHRFLYNAMIPDFPGASPLGMDVTETDATYEALVEFDNNEGYGLEGGLQPWSVGSYGETPHLTGPVSTISNLKLWNCADKVIYNYETGNLTYTDLIVINDKNVMLAGQGGVGWYGGDYVAFNHVIDGARIVWCGIGIGPSVQSGNGTQTFADCYLKNYYNYQQEPVYRYTPQVNGDPVEIILDTLTCVDSGAPDQGRLFGPPADLVMADRLAGTSNHPAQRQRVFVKNYQGNVSDDFRIYFPGAARGSTFAAQTLNGNGSANISGPPASATNATSMSTYGVCMGGELPPASPTSKTRVSALVGPMTSEFRPAALTALTLHAWAAHRFLGPNGADPTYDLYPWGVVAAGGTAGTIIGQDRTRNWVQDTAGERATWQTSPPRLVADGGDFYVAYNGSSPSGVALTGAFTVYWVGSQTDDTLYVPLGSTAGTGRIEITAADAVKITNDAGTSVSSAYTGRATGRRFLRFRRDASNACSFCASDLAEISLGTLSGTITLNCLLAATNPGLYTANGQSFEYLLATTNNTLVTGTEDADVRAWITGLTGVGDLL